MKAALPEEIILEILSPLLRVSDQRFSNTSTKSGPLATTDESISALLLVCRAWLRIATPLLYDVVILRSTGQAKSLKNTLKMNKPLGRFIKKLRVEGGFGSYMHNILQETPNVNEIFISLHLHASESSSGLVNGLGLINPTRVIIWDDVENLLQNKSVVQLMTALGGIVSKWSNMDTHAESPRFCHGYVQRYRGHIGVFPRHEKGTIQTIEARVAVTPEEAASSFNLCLDSRLKSTLRFVDIRPTKRRCVSVPSLLPLDPSFCPMTDGMTPQDTVELIWARILLFAASVEIQPTFPLSLLQQHQYRRLNTQRLNYLLVSKMFHRLALPYLYRQPYLDSRESLQAFRRRIVKNPTLGLHLYAMNVHNHGGFYQLREGCIFSHTPHLTRLNAEYGVRMDWEMFRVLSESAGATLTHLVVSVIVPHGDIPDAHVFTRFVTLVTLGWESRDLYFRPITKNGSLYAALPALNELRLRSDSLYPLLTEMELPHLQRVDLFGDFQAHLFLKKHGPKIREVGTRRSTLDKVMTLCPNLCNINITFGLLPTNTSEGYQLRCSPPHLAVRKITVHKCCKYRKSEEEAEWETILSTLRLTDFPVLQELQIPECEWPCTEFDIRRSFWVKWADELYGKGIKVTDKEGVHWRPRLKTASRRRS
ncbi:hypothetical protein C8R43DRAFT_944881 [Mycena crocata]|nr:hypothetical protein C8R43DRAFT_944881 [Mycena crocata]